ncbi:4'-phosphopantetheinyl transferase family protein [Sunxiuqinia sp. A32]|uniref:4'-phosphopantetheinyl transferase family protein n=1 Tax=Sunxiuqinia sp. A32 TaxID=3461496 RepID=UPI0040460E06
MPLLREIEINDGLLLLWQISEDVDDLFRQVGKIADIHDFEKIKNLKRKKEWLAVRMLLKHIDCSIIGIAYNEKRQPTITHPDYNYISISHSGEIAGILVHKSFKVGLDIENLNRDFIRVENKYLSPQEKELTTEIQNGHALFWCAKEAVFKVAGIAGIHFAKQISMERPTNKTVSAKLFLENTIKKYQLHFFEIDNQLVTYLIDDLNQN